MSDQQFLSEANAIESVRAIVKRLVGGTINSTADARKLLAELGDVTLATRQHAESCLLQRDGAYHERNEVVAAYARLVAAAGYHVGVKKTDIEGWDPEWHNCVFIDTPAGQLSWHFHDLEAPLFSDLPPYEGEWDGHTTEQKYARLARLTGQDFPQLGDSSSSSLVAGAARLLAMLAPHAGERGVVEDPFATLARILGERDRAIDMLPVTANVVAALQVVLDQVDYTRSACTPTEMVGAVLPEEAIALAREALDKWAEAPAPQSPPTANENAQQLATALSGA